MPESVAKKKCQGGDQSKYTKSFKCTVCSIFCNLWLCLKPNHSVLSPANSDSTSNFINILSC